MKKPPKGFWKLYKGTALATIYGSYTHHYVKWLLDMELDCMVRDGVEMPEGLRAAQIIRSHGKSATQFVFPFMLKGKRK